MYVCIFYPLYYPIYPVYNLTLLPTTPRYPIHTHTHTHTYTYYVDASQAGRSMQPMVLSASEWTTRGETGNMAERVARL
jgi:hypothetical protein